MLTNVVIATLRNLLRNRTYAAVSIGGLSLALAVGILTAAFARHELSFESFLPGHDKIYVVASKLGAFGQPERRLDGGPAQISTWLKLEFPDVETARYVMAGPGRRVSVRRGDQESNEAVAWVDPSFFSIVRLKPIAGNLDGAMSRPDSLVLTRALARKYFGQDAPIGQSLELDRKLTLRIAAVVEDLPGNSDIAATMFAPAVANASPLAIADSRPYRLGTFTPLARTYVKAPSASAAAAINARMEGFVKEHIYPPQVRGKLPPGTSLEMQLRPITSMHLFDRAVFDPEVETPPGSLDLVYSTIGLAALIMLIASVNFVNLMTARASSRAVEVGMRKANGAQRGQLVFQFLLESFVYVVISVCLAFVIARAVLPGFNAVMMRRMTLEPDAFLFGIALLLVIGVALLAGSYPAFVLSSMSPRAVLRSGSVASSGSIVVRRALVVVQVAILISLLLAVGVIYGQTQFALTRGVRLQRDNVLVITAPCHGLFAEHVRALPGVRGVACSSSAAVGLNTIDAVVKKPSGEGLQLSFQEVDFGFFEMFGVRPVAGRLPSVDHPGDAVPSYPVAAASLDSWTPPRTAVINVAAARALGQSPGQVLGQVLRLYTNGQETAPVQITGVVPDVAVDLTKGPVKPAIFLVDPRQFFIVNARLNGDVQSNLAAIDRLWRQYGDPQVLRRRFFDDYIATLLASVVRQAWFVSALAAIAVFIAVLGLFGLAAFETARRTKEIGVRRALGASRARVVSMLLWSFTQPVLWATLLAWPISWWLLTRWLDRFAYRIDLTPWQFLSASAMALLIVVITVGRHSTVTASARPSTALRDE